MLQKCCMTNMNQEPQERSLKSYEIRHVLTSLVSSIRVNLGSASLVHSKFTLDSA